MAVTGNKITINNTISNTSVNLIQITEDKLEKILIQHVKKLSRPRDLIGVIGLVLSLFGLWLTSDFNSTIFPTQTLQGFFGAVLLVAIGYLGYVAWNYIKHHSSVDEIMKDIKNES